MKPFNYVNPGFKELDIDDQTSTGHSIAFLKRERLLARTRLPTLHVFH